MVKGDATAASVTQGSPGTHPGGHAPSGDCRFLRESSGPRQRPQTRKSLHLPALTQSVAVLATSLCLTLWTPAVGNAQGVRCQPVSQRSAELGCWVLANTPLDSPMPEAPFWHLETYPTRSAADAARGSNGTVVEALNKIWLLTVAGPEWRSASGSHVAAIGPLPVRPGVRYTAQYMEAVFTPRMTSSAHRHSGAEAWYTAAGETCLETPAGTQVSRAGGPKVIIPEGSPMELTATGTATRRGLVIILYDASQPSTTLTPEWTPKGLCRAR